MFIHFLKLVCECNIKKVSTKAKIEGTVIFKPHVECISVSNTFASQVPSNLK